MQTIAPLVQVVIPHKPSWPEEQNMCSSYLSALRKSRKVSAVACVEWCIYGGLQTKYYYNKYKAWSYTEQESPEAHVITERPVCLDKGSSSNWTKLQPFCLQAKATSCSLKFVTVVLNRRKRGSPGPDQKVSTAVGAI